HVGSAIRTMARGCPGSNHRGISHMKRSLLLALGVVVAWAGTATPSFASAFGLFYKRSCCGGCSFCVRPYNAFSPLTCGVADVGCCGHGSGIPSNPKWWTAFGHKGDPCFDNGCSAFGTCGGQIGFSGVPVDRKGCGNFGLGLCSA